VSKSDKSNLERHGNIWRVVVAVPRHLQEKVGATKLKRSLKTDSRTVANVLKQKVIGELQRQIRAAAQGSPGDPLLEEALIMREEFERGKMLDGTWRNDPDEFSALEAIELKASQLRGEPIEDDLETDTPVYDPDREAMGSYYLAVATGTATPINTLIARWHSQCGSRKERTKGDDRRALGYLEDWCKGNHVSPTIEAITRKVAGRFIGDLPTIAASAKGGQRLTNRTANKYISSLSGYWKWLKTRGMVEENIWLDQSLPKEQTDPEHDARPFTEDEMRAVLSGTPAMVALVPLIRIAALTGARIDVITSLRVKDCANGLFRFKKQKKEKKDRLVPIHSTLVPLVEELVRGKNPDDALFPCFPVPPPGSQRERSMPAVKAFGHYRKSLGVDEVPPGKKRSIVTFHSFRRWFISRAEQAGIDGNIIAVVVGHKRPGITLTLYSEGPLEDQLRRCVEAVRLPG